MSSSDDYRDPTAPPPLRDAEPDAADEAGTPPAEQTQVVDPGTAPFAPPAASGHDVPPPPPPPGATAETLPPAPPSPYGSASPTGSPYGVAGYPSPPAPYGAAGAPAAPGTNTSALVLTIVSGLAVLVGIVFIVGLLFVPALVLGIIGLAKHSADPQGARRMARFGWIAFAAAVGLCILGFLAIVGLAAASFSTSP
ncbi:hypothetical protein H9L10_00785 [Phycicoccus endophyticus]|uniref:DUF4190 domain-containing protein n=1 Tax=Phycicoccus endophyticus TaxID=1690220 RepID=A0A7G9R263_9MICO|nr:hypothetical protein [Phycicoccus endophyticus]NHI19661.1 hypothetical protein [Phycicoccus endophyticus]QNN49688.1 hypothetical protein H9L10_00785 [Phycicoccus endophyticus]GGL34118.1 hypothetical protein GCM10012283_15680 [Phycicoccus endophyticus]